MDLPSLNAYRGEGALIKLSGTSLFATLFLYELRFYVSNYKTQTSHGGFTNTYKIQNGKKNE